MPMHPVASMGTRKEGVHVMGSVLEDAPDFRNVRVLRRRSGAVGCAARLGGRVVGGRVVGGCTPDGANRFLLGEEVRREEHPELYHGLCV